MIDVAEARVGDKVHYIPDYYAKGTWLNGKIKEIDDGRVRVVFHCAGEWDAFMDYTGALTDEDDLFLGWRH